MESSGDPPLPLAGFRVLYLTRFLAGPYAAMVLADLGTEVIKVEQPAGGDDSRNFGPFHASSESWSFIQANAELEELTGAGIAYDKHPEAGQ